MLRDWLMIENLVVYAMYNVRWEDLILRQLKQ